MSTANTDERACPCSLTELRSLFAVDSSVKLASIVHKSPLVVLIVFQYRQHFYLVFMKKCRLICIHCDF